MNEELIITNWLKEHGIKYSEDQVKALIGYIHIVREYAPNINLVANGDLPHIVERHLLDSLLALTVYNIPREFKVADVGSGSGFPGIPIAIMRPDLQMYLIESRRKRSLFLSKAINHLGLANAMVINDRWENIGMLFDIILARAVFPEAEIIDKFRGSLNPDGVIIYFAKYNDIKVLRLPL